MEKKQARPWQWLLLGLLGAALGWAVACQTVIQAGGYELGAWPRDWRYADSDIPMISSADGFLHIHIAHEALERGYQAARIVNFANLTALLSRASSQPVEAVAFYMSLFCHLGLGIVAALWGRLLNVGRVSAFCAAFLIALMPAWLERGGPGRFDTDLAILLFWQAGLYFLVRALYLDGRPSARPSIKYTLAALFFLALLAAVWTSGWALAGLTLGAWAFLFLPHALFSYKLRAIIAAAIAAWAGAVVFLPPNIAPAPQFILEMVHTRLTLAFGTRPELFYTSIKELNSLSVWKLLENLGGSAPGGLAIIAAAIVAAIKGPMLRLPLVFALVFISAGVKVNRLVYFGSFQLALCAAFLPAFLAGGFTRFPRISGRKALAAGFLIFAGILISSAHWAGTRDLDLRWEGAHDRLLEILRRENGTQAAHFWNWWDDGYFLEARTKNITPLFHGGAQTHTMAYIAAHPFVMEDRRAAARWMRFFAVRREWGMIPLIQAWGEEGAWQRLEKILATENLADVAADMAQIPGGAEYFFPRGRVYWYMPGLFTKISLWWVPLGLTRAPDEKLVRPHLEAIKRNEFLYDPDKKALTVSQKLWDRGYQKFGLVLNTETHPLAPPWPTGGAPYIVYSNRNDNAYITDEEGLKTLPLYMLAPGGPPLAHFRLVVVNEGGGIWEILP